MSPEDRFWAKVDVGHPLGCWQWTAYTNAKGYGRFHLRGKARAAHRVAYVLLMGEIPEGLQIDHLCRNRACVNPDHMEPVTARDNMLRGYGAPAKHARKTRCSVHGVVLAGDNIYPSSSGRPCRACIDESKRRWTAPERRRERHARLLADPSLARHGSKATYNEWLCRCDPCRAAVEASRERTKARQMERAL